MIRIFRNFSKKCKKYFCSSGASMDKRHEMVGHWESSNGDIMKVEGCAGYFTMKITECNTDPSLECESFVLRYPQGWLCDDNVYYAEGRHNLSLSLSDSGDEIYISEMRQTFRRP